MKRFLAFCMMGMLVAGAAFAATEQRSSINYSLGGSTIGLSYDADMKAKQELFIPFMLDVDNTWFMEKPLAGALRVGFDANVTLYFSGHPATTFTVIPEIMEGTLTVGEKTVDEQRFFFGSSAAIGAAFLYDINAYNAARFTPAIQITYENGLGGDSIGPNVFYFSVSLNAAYQHYFTDKIGLNAGFDADIPLFGSVSSGSTSTTITLGFNWRVFVGVALRFGGIPAFL